MSTTIVFDVNETLLDLSALDPLFADAFGDKSTRRVWFSQMLQSAFAGTIAGSYHPFSDLARASLEMTARKRGVVLDDERKRRILAGMAVLPAHGDVASGLTTLRDAGFRLAVLTNSTASTIASQLEHAKIADYFDLVLSTDAVSSFKPDPKTYAYACERLEVAPGDAMLVAAHDWDVMGAMRAGMRAAFVSRHGTSLNPLEPKPEIVAANINAVAQAIVAGG
ncbi:MAG: haloacid dehalogenase type II [Vulcanimicrobiaceae bacterium]